MKYTFFLLLFLVGFTVGAQDNELRTDNFIYRNNIRTVRFHVNGLPVSQPIIELNSRSRLLLTFDDTDADDKNYSYKIRHYNADWTRSDLAETDYTDGFAEADIEEYDYAFNTVINFTHYALMLPNEDVEFAVSGNYTVTIFDSDTGDLILTRRFTVVEPLVTVSEKFVRPVRTDKQDTHHEFDFTVRHEQIGVKRPLVELKAVVLQNGRWDNAITGLQPRFSNNGISEFDFSDKVIFPAGVEFRYADLRSLDYRQLGVFDIQQSEDGYDVTLQKDNKRFQSGFSSYRDINGDFVIENIDDAQMPGPGLISALQSNQQQTDTDTGIPASQMVRSNYFNSAEEYLETNGLNALVSDYAYVTFSLVSPTEYYDDDVYLFGKMTDWQIKPEFKLRYNDKYGAYMGEAFLKQGFHNYYYVRVPQSGGAPDWDLTEGNWYETENEYTIIIYYRSFTGRYDRAVGAYVFASGSGF